MSCFLLSVVTTHIAKNMVSVETIKKNASNVLNFRSPVISYCKLLRCTPMYRNAIVLGVIPIIVPMKNALGSQVVTESI